jgi:hypothetical protein
MSLSLSIQTSSRIPFLQWLPRYLYTAILQGFDECCPNNEEEKNLGWQNLVGFLNLNMGLILLNTV